MECPTLHMEKKTRCNKASVIIKDLNFCHFLFRFFAIVYPLKQLSRSKKNTVTTSFVIIWVCAFSQVVVRNVVPVVKSKNTINKTSAHYLTAVFLLYNVFPFMVVFYLYARIIKRLRSRQNELAQKSESGASSRKEFVTRCQRKTVIMLITVLVLFVISQWPYTIFSIITAYVPETQNSATIQTTYSLLTIFSFISYATNPVIYNFFGEKFRAGFRQMISNKCM